MFEFGSTKSQRQINTANPDVRNKNTTLSTFLPCQKHALPVSKCTFYFFFIKTLHLLYIFLTLRTKSICWVWKSSSKISCETVNQEE